ncbi:TPA: hypothetical protein JLC23_004306 [Escherichia coli]|uniref:hypothetical protein n=1 Tax=Escherichia marmotae TaxID=1499973 RepID=UPI00164FA53A|nr:hypothetical protein [Escherichia marmotae]HAV8297167.1 hypothetical protein [Escherichia coli]HAV8306436.1 hypothetical protein [Escherichia coli]HAV8329135.1 hypothetical protein [Escherichia coli]HAW0754681.1 hypothetical protein [Escherichia coli]HAW2732600.1 hypothetical protein [Escherichia coli]
MKKKECGYSLIEVGLFSVLIGMVIANIYVTKQRFVNSYYNKQFSLTACSYANAFSRYINLAPPPYNISMEQIINKGFITPFAKSQIGYFTVYFQTVQKDGYRYGLMKLHSNKKITVEDEELLSRNIGIYSSVKGTNTLKGLYYNIDFPSTSKPGDGDIYAIIPPHYSKYQQCR